MLTFTAGQAVDRWRPEGDLTALLFGVPVGVGLSYWIYRVFGGMYEMPYEIPWKEIGIAAVFVFVIISLTMYYSVKKTEKQNIVETIRAENI